MLYTLSDILEGEISLDHLRRYSYHKLYFYIEALLDEGKISRETFDTLITQINQYGQIVNGLETLFNMLADLKSQLAEVKTIEEQFDVLAKLNSDFTAENQTLLQKLQDSEEYINQLIEQNISLRDEVQALKEQIRDTRIEKSLYDN